MKRNEKDCLYQPYGRVVPLSAIFGEQKHDNKSTTRLGTTLASSSRPAFSRVFF